MSKIWYIPDDGENPELHCQKNLEIISPEELCRKTGGVEYSKVDLNTCEIEGALAILREKYNYKFEDVMVCSKADSTNLETFTKKYTAEHNHSDVEMRLLLKGAGYFDVRDLEDRWIRIYFTPGDLLILPEGVYHRFTLLSDNFEVRRFFTEEPKWKGHFRLQEQLDCYTN